MKLLSIKQAAQELGVTRQGVYKMVRAGVFHPAKIIKINKPVIRIYSSEIERLKKQKHAKSN